MHRNGTEKHTAKQDRLIRFGFAIGKSPRPSNQSVKATKCGELCRKRGRRLHGEWGHNDGSEGEAQGDHKLKGGGSGLSARDGEGESGVLLGGGGGGGGDREGEDGGREDRSH